MGPLAHMDMFRFEAKHKVFKNLARNTNSFVNVLKTLAIKHQQSACRCRGSNTFKDVLCVSKKKKLDTLFINQHRGIFQNYLNDGLEILVTKWFRYNNYRYNEGILISHINLICEICRLLYYTLMATCI